MNKQIEIKMMTDSNLDTPKSVSGYVVALVGPAMYLQGSKYGRDIDSYDIVARINRGVELVDFFGEDIGKKTDIVYSCLIEKPANAGKIEVDSLVEKYGVRSSSILGIIK